MLFRIYRKLYYSIIFFFIKIFYSRYFKNLKSVEFRSIPIIENFKNLQIEIGENCVIKEYLIIRGGGELIIGKNTHIGSFNIIGCNSRVVIGEDCMIADYVTIRDTNHNFQKCDISMNQQGISSNPVIIENDVWIGHGVIILPGVKIKTGSIIGAGSVVTKNIPSYTIAVGNPAKIVKRRK